MPETASALTECLRETHRRFTCHVNRRDGWRGYLWQGRLSSCVMDQAHLLAAARHVERNPVRAGLRATPGDWPWSSARSHLEDRADGLTERRPLLNLVANWALAADDAEDIGQRRVGRALNERGLLIERGWRSMLDARDRGQAMTMERA